MNALHKRPIILLAIFSLFGISLLSAQDNTYLVKLADKDNSPYSVSNPEEFLSQKAIDRRNKYQIQIDASDLPVNPSYIKKIQSLGAQIIYQSKWINSLSIKVDNDSILKSIEDLKFVKGPLQITYTNLKKSQLPSQLLEEKNRDSYGKSSDQIEMINGKYLHQMGYDGSNMMVAVLDAGFYHVDRMEAFKSLVEEQRIIYTYDYVEHETDVYDDGAHGMEVLSCMAAQLSGDYTGTSPGASYVLLRTENSKSEFQLEEDAFIAALELADSMGVDLISSSLGYNSFDDSVSSHTYSDLDGKTLRISIASQMATEKGIVVVTSSGNEGFGPWEKITAPADAKDVITVGAVDVKNRYAIFSSQGPSADNRVKPDVVALGYKTKVIDHSGKYVVNASGSSYSAPVIAGMTTSLMQAFPEANVHQIRNALLTSSSNYHQPNKYVGYGLPDYSLAYILLHLYTDQSKQDKGVYGIAINQYTNQFRMVINTTESHQYKLSLKSGMFSKTEELIPESPGGTIIVSLKLAKLNTDRKFKVKIEDLSTGEKQTFKGKTKKKIQIL